MKKLALILLLGLMTCTFVGCSDDSESDVEFSKSVHPSQTKVGEADETMGENIGDADDPDKTKAEEENAE